MLNNLFLRVGGGGGTVTAKRLRVSDVFRGFGLLLCENVAALGLGSLRVCGSRVMGSPWLEGCGRP